MSKSSLDKHACFGLFSKREEREFTLAKDYTFSQEE